MTTVHLIVVHGNRAAILHWHMSANYTCDSEHIISFLSDYDECTNLDHGCVCDSLLPDCVAQCNNVDGTYTCSCEAGYYILDTDLLTCIGGCSSDIQYLVVVGVPMIYNSTL